MNNEDTIYDNVKTNRNDNEETQLGLNVKQTTEKNNGKKSDVKLESNSKVEENNAQTEDGNRKKSDLKKVAAGLGFGILMGASAAFVSAGEMDLSTLGMDALDGGDEGLGESDEGLGMNLSDGEIPVASSVSDEMSFSEAFAAAREEVGAGGVFEWNGNVYNTYYAEEWENMSEEEKDEFANHLNVMEIPEDDETFDDELLVEASEEDIEVEASEEDIEVEASEEDVEVEASEEDVEVEASEEDIEVTDEIIDSDDEVVMAEAEEGIEILGVYEDEENGANIGVVEVDGQEAFLVDVDADNIFDYITADIDGDGVISDYEVADISGENMTVDMLDVDNDFDDSLNDDSMAFNDFDEDMDYINDADVDDFMA